MFRLNTFLTNHGFKPMQNYGYGKVNASWVWGNESDGFIFVFRKLSKGIKTVEVRSAKVMETFDITSGESKKDNIDKLKQCINDLISN
jgi:hypothetical protein